MSEENKNKENEKKKEKSLTADYEMNKENLEKVNTRLNDSFMEDEKRRAAGKKKKKSAKELLAEEEEEKRKAAEKEKEVDPAMDPNTVRGRMNMIYMAHVQRRREMFLARMEMKAFHNVLDTLDLTGKAMAEYLMLANYAKRPDGTLSKKRLNGPIPEGLLGQKGGDQEKIEEWLLEEQASGAFMDHVDDMAELAPEAFVNKMAGEYANHMRIQKQMKNPEAVQVAPRGFHAPEQVPSVMPGILQDEPAAPVLRPMQDSEQNV